jgi:hypothetical protein
MSIVKKWEDNLQKIIDYNNIELEYKKYKKFLSDYYKAKDRKKLRIPNIDRDKDILKQVEDYYKFVKIELEKNKIFILRSRLDSILKLINDLNRFREEYNNIKDIEYSEEKIFSIEEDINSLNSTMIDGYSYKELLEVYININKYIKTKN